MRQLRHDAQGGAGAALPRSGDRVALAFRREHAKFHRGPLRSEADDVAVVQDYVPRDPRTIDEGAVLRAQVADAERRAVPHDGGVARRDVEIALDVEANVRQWMAAAAITRQRLARAGTGGRLPRYTGTGSVLVSVSISG